MIAKEGYFIVAMAALLALVCWAIGLQMESKLRLFLFAFGALALAFTLYFFRDPQRTPPRHPDADRMILAPADGKVVEIVEETDSLYLNGPVRRLSIFLSPLNVHVNRAPVSGVVEFDRYVSGDYLVAWHPKASELNERSQLGVRHASGARVLFKQIAGAVARRIVYHIRVGDTVTAGERFGIVKFGSRMDVIVAPEVQFDVEIGQMVRAGETIIGFLPPAEPATVGGAERAAERD
ncbi:MAG: phosphatidylserine decarboxylase family protein [Rhodothermales bacterium]